MFRHWTGPITHDREQKAKVDGFHSSIRQNVALVIQLDFLGVFLSLFTHHHQFQ
jgi:hypothetical protein